MCTPRRVNPPPSSSIEIASSKSFASGGSIDLVNEGQRRPGARPAAAAVVLLTTVAVLRADVEHLARLQFKVADTIGDVIYFKSLRASKDGRAMMRRGIPTRFGAASYRGAAPDDPTHSHLETVGER